MKQIIFFLPFVFFVMPSMAQKKPRTKAPLYVCDSTLFSYTAKTTARSGTASYKWSRAAVAGIANVAAEDTVAQIREYLVNTTNKAVLVKYAITISANGCDHTDTLPVIVHPTPRLVSVKAVNVCDSTALSYMPESSVAGSVFRWSRPEIIGVKNSSANGEGANKEMLNDAAFKITKVPLYYETEANGCIGKDTVWVSLIPRPFGGLKLAPADTVLAGQQTEIEFVTTDTIQLWHQWKFGDGQYANTFTNPAKHVYNGRESGWRKISNQIINRFGCIRSFGDSIYIKGDATPRPLDTIAVVRNYSMAIYPVPYTTDLWLKYSLNTDQRAQLSIHDLAGRIILTQPLILKAGNQIIRMPVDRLTRGVVYVLRITSSTIQYEDKFYKK